METLDTCAILDTTRTLSFHLSLNNAISMYAIHLLSGILIIVMHCILCVTFTMISPCNCVYDASFLSICVSKQASPVVRENVVTCQLG